MSLLAVIAMGMLGMSALETRNAQDGRAQAQAKANARLALMMALGQLQEYAGDDRRISIAADQVMATGGDGSETAAIEGRRFWTGIYDSWHHSLEDRPEPRFRAWLVSNPDPSSMSEADATQPSGSADMVLVVGIGSAGAKAEDRVEVPKIAVEQDGKKVGNIAWWTGDQGVKTMAGKRDPEPEAGLAGVSGKLQAAPSHGIAITKVENVQPFSGLDRTDPKLNAMTSLQQVALMADNSDTAEGLFHDLAARSSGLLTDVRKGGFRGDLSMELELSPKDPLYTVDIPSLPRNRDKERNGINFEELQSYYHLYKKLEPLSGEYTTGGSIPAGTLGFKTGDTLLDTIADEAFHFKTPAVVSLQVIMSLRTLPVSNAAGSLNRLYVCLDPVIDIWNPLDVPVVIPTTSYLMINFFAAPYTFDISAAGKTWECPLITGLSSFNTSNYLSMLVGKSKSIILKPGEVIKLSQGGPLLRQTQHSHTVRIEAKPGFNYESGLARPFYSLDKKYVDIPDDAIVRYTIRPNGLTAGKTSRSGESWTGFNQHSRHFGLTYHEFWLGDDRDTNSTGYGGIGIDFDFGNRRSDPARPWQANTRGTKQPSERIYADRPQYAHIFPTIGEDETRPLSVGQLKTTKAPVMMYTYSAKTENTSPTGTRSMLRYNPKAHWIDFYALDDTEMDLKAFDFQFEPLNSWVNRKIEASANGNAYYGGGYNAAYGNSFVITHSIPREPLHSLGAMQHSMANGFLNQATIANGYAGLNGRQVMLPQISHAIGNSLAPGVISPDKTSRIISGGRPVADHSYLANRALWDSWVFSSVAPQDADSYSTKRSHKKVAEEFLSGTKPLPITQYQPDLGDKSLEAVLEKLFPGNTPGPEASELMTSLIRVDGMFNVNSTSVEAWKALLASLINHDILTNNASGKTEKTTLSTGEVPVTSLMVPASREAEGGAGGGAVDAKEPNQWMGYRVLTEDEITLLAEAIVREVRKRGPFLSLADFVNRRVGTNKELARAGAIQSALDSDTVTVNQAYSDPDRSVSAAVAARFPFPEAEEGPLSTGISGIVKQADILTPLAPILSVRSDTFLIRGYGEVLDSKGNVIAKAWCEAQVERDADYLNAEDPRETLPDNLTNDDNKKFGRKFQITSFRWLAEKEI